MPRSHHWRLSTNCQLYTTDRHFWLCCMGQAHRSPLIGKKYGHLANPHNKVTRMRDLESFKHYSSMISSIISQNQLPKPRPHFEGALRSSLWGHPALRVWFIFPWTAVTKQEAAKGTPPPWRYKAPSLRIFNHGALGVHATDQDE